MVKSTLVVEVNVRQVGTFTAEPCLPTLEAAQRLLSEAAKGEV